MRKVIGMKPLDDLILGKEEIQQIIIEEPLKQKTLKKKKTKRFSRAMSSAKAKKKKK